MSSRVEPGSGFGRILAAKIEFSYGAGQTVNLLALRLQWFESTPTQALPELFFKCLSGRLTGNGHSISSERYQPIPNLKRDQKFNLTRRESSVGQRRPLPVRSLPEQGIGRTRRCLEGSSHSPRYPE